MSDLIAVAYPDKETAEKVRQRLAQLTLEHTIELEDAVVVDRDENGKVKLHQAHPDKVLPEISQYGGEMIQSSLDDDAEAKLREVLEDAGAAV